MCKQTHSSVPTGDQIRSDTTADTMPDDLFDNERLQKMIALGIYDEEQVVRMKRMSSKEPTTSAPSETPVQRPADRALQEVLGRPVGHRMDRLQYGQQMGRDFRSGPRGGRVDTGGRGPL